VGRSWGPGAPPPPHPHTPPQFMRGGGKTVSARFSIIFPTRGILREMNPLKSRQRPHCSGKINGLDRLTKAAGGVGSRGGGGVTDLWPRR